MSKQNENNEQQSHRLQVTVDKVLFYNDMWGIISVKPKQIHGDTDFYPEVNGQWNNFVIRGNIPFKPDAKQELDIEISDKQYDSKRNSAFYEILRVHVEELNTIESQQRFLGAILTEHRAKLILEAYPDSMIIDDIKDDKIDLTLIKGIGASTADEVKKAIEQNKDMGALMSETADVNLTGRMLHKLIDKYDGDTTKALYAVRESLYNLCSISGISFKRVDDAAMARGESKTSPKRINAYSNHYFDEIASQGHSWVQERTFLEQSLSDLGVNAKFIRDYMESEHGQKFFYWNHNTKQISSMRMYEAEKNTLKHLLRIANRYVVPEKLNIGGAIENAEDKLGVKYTDEQKSAIQESLKHGVFILNGCAGSGKTMCVKGVIEILKSLELSYIGSAISGKAANVMVSRGIDAGTIHRVFELGMKKKNKEVDTVFGEESEEMGEEKGASHYDVIIVDESSMVNAQIFSEILPKIKDGAKLILVGDSGQLSAIGHGDVLRDLLSTKYFPSVELKQIHRQAQDSGIIEIAGDMRLGEQVIKSNHTGKQVYGVNKDMILIGYQDKDLISDDLRKILLGQKKQITKPEDLLDFQVVVAMKERGDLSSRAINNLAQSVFNDMSKPFVSHGGYDYRVGDKVIVKGNSYDIAYYDDIEHYENVKLFGVTPQQINEELQVYSDPDEATEWLNSIKKANKGSLFNGTMGIVVGLEDKMNKNGEMEKILIVEFENFGVKVYEKSELDSLELAYAATCHRLQGSTIKNVIVVLDYSAFTLLSRQWVYTAITRASNKCVLMIQSSALVKAISTDASGSRRTFLEDMIKQVKESGR